MNETTASKSSSCSNGAPSPFERADSRPTVSASTERGGYSVLVLLNLVCLDAPVVAICWLALFAHSFGIEIPHGGISALFLSAWLIYLADRLVDNLSLGAPTPTSLRQDFCRRHRLLWLVALGSVGLADTLVIGTRLDPHVLTSGAIVGISALAYFLINQLAPFVWRKLPLKEICIGFLFAAGVTVPLVRGLTSASIWPIFLFGVLCAMNCICIALWETQLDRAQARVSIATAFPRIRGWVGPALAVVCLTSGGFALGQASARALWLCQLASATLLWGLAAFGSRLGPNLRTACADLVLLTPVLALALG